MLSNELKVVVKVVFNAKTPDVTVNKSVDRPKPEPKVRDLGIVNDGSLVKVFKAPYTKTPKEPTNFFSKSVSNGPSTLKPWIKEVIKLIVAGKHLNATKVSKYLVKFEYQCQG
jgi:hypothetical protein